MADFYTLERFSSEILHVQADLDGEATFVSPAPKKKPQQQKAAPTSTSSSSSVAREPSPPRKNEPVTSYSAVKTLHYGPPSAKKTGANPARRQQKVPPKPQNASFFSNILSLIKGSSQPPPQPQKKAPVRQAPASTSVVKTFQSTAIRQEKENRDNEQTDLEVEVCPPAFFPFDDDETFAVTHPTSPMDIEMKTISSSGDQPSPAPSPSKLEEEPQTPKAVEPCPHSKQAPPSLKAVMSPAKMASKMSALLRSPERQLSAQLRSPFVGGAKGSLRSMRSPALNSYYAFDTCTPSPGGGGGGGGAILSSDVSYCSDDYEDAGNLYGADQWMRNVSDEQLSLSTRALYDQTFPLSRQVPLTLESLQPSKGGIITLRPVMMSPMRPQPQTQGRSNSTKVLEVTQRGKTTRPTSISDFEIGRPVGAGKFGTLYVARARRCPSLIVAIKVIHKRQLSRQNQQQLLLEVKHLDALHGHTNVIQLFDYFVDERRIYLVMEYASKGDLYHSLQSQPEGKYEEKEAASVFQQVCRAIEHCHRNNIIHRDLKPENLVWGADGNLKLIDFGWSAHCTLRDRRKTMCGTLDYLAPELVTNQSYGSPLDVWCLGVLLYELLCGSPPFEDENIARTKLNIKCCLYTLPSHLSDGARDIIRKLLQLDPYRRPYLDEILSHPWITSNTQPTVPETPSEPSTPSTLCTSSSSSSSSSSSEASSRPVFELSSLADMSGRSSMFSDDSDEMSFKRTSLSFSPILRPALVPQRLELSPSSPSHRSSFSSSASPSFTSGSPLSSVSPTQIRRSPVTGDIRLMKEGNNEDSFLLDEDEEYGEDLKSRLMKLQMTIDDMTLDVDGVDFSEHSLSSDDPSDCDTGDSDFL